MISLARITYSSTVEHSNDDQGDDSFLKKVIALTIENKSRCHLLKYFVSHKESTVESLEQYALLIQIYDPSEEEENPIIGFCCGASPDFETTKEVDVYPIDLDVKYVEETMTKCTAFWKQFVFPKLSR